MQYFQKELNQPHVLLIEITLIVNIKKHMKHLRCLHFVIYLDSVSVSIFLCNNLL